jgi:hypothetical protein
LKKIQLAAEPIELSSLSYPNTVYYDKVLGANPFEQLNKDTQQYEFIGNSTTEFVYYTIALYQQNWGLTDYKKSEYQIMVQVDIIDYAEAVGANPVSSTGSSQGSSTAVSSQIQVLEDGSILKWIDTEPDFKDYIVMRSKADGTYVEPPKVDASESSSDASTESPVVQSALKAKLEEQ